jgi:hypothetical protein
MNLLELKLFRSKISPFSFSDTGMIETNLDALYDGSSETWADELVSRIQVGKVLISNKSFLLKYCTRTANTPVKRPVGSLVIPPPLLNHLSVTSWRIGPPQLIQNSNVH